MEVALKLLNDRYETKLLKMKPSPGTVHASLSESDLCTTTYSSSLSTDSDLCSGSYASLTDSSLHTSTRAPFAESGICAMAST